MFKVLSDYDNIYVSDKPAFLSLHDINIDLDGSFRFLFETIITHSPEDLAIIRPHHFLPCYFSLLLQGIKKILVSESLTSHKSHDSLVDVIELILPGC